MIFPKPANVYRRRKCGWWKDCLGLFLHELLEEPIHQSSSNKKIDRSNMIHSFRCSYMTSDIVSEAQEASGQRSTLPYTGNILLYLVHPTITPQTFLHSYIPHGVRCVKVQEAPCSTGEVSNWSAQSHGTSRTIVSALSARKGVKNMLN